MVKPKYLNSIKDKQGCPSQVTTMSTSKTSFTNHYLLEPELSPKVNAAMSTEEFPADKSDSGEVRWN